MWKDIEDHYYDRSFNGVDWNEVHARYKPLVEAAKDDREFYSLMSRMTGELHDAHTRFNSPEQWRNIKKQQGVGSGLSLDEIDGKIVVTAIRRDSNAAHVGIEPGMVVLTVDGKPVEDRIAEIESAKAASSTSRATRMFTYSRLLAGPTDTEVKLGLERADGSHFETEVRRQVYSAAPNLATDKMPSGNAYIRFDGFQPSITKEFRQAFERFRNSPGLIVDLRRNGGGDLGVLGADRRVFFRQEDTFREGRDAIGQAAVGVRGSFAIAAGTLRRAKRRSDLFGAGGGVDRFAVGEFVGSVCGGNAGFATSPNRGQPKLRMRFGDCEAAGDEGRRSSGDERSAVVFAEGPAAGRDWNFAGPNGGADTEEFAGERRYGACGR